MDGRSLVSSRPNLVKQGRRLYVASPPRGSSQGLIRLVDPVRLLIERHLSKVLRQRHRRCGWSRRNTPGQSARLVISVPTTDGLDRRVARRLQMLLRRYGLRPWIVSPDDPAFRRRWAQAAGWRCGPGKAADGALLGVLVPQLNIFVPAVIALSARGHIVCGWYAADLSQMPGPAVILAVARILKRTRKQDRRRSHPGVKPLSCHRNIPRKREWIGR